MYIGNASRLDTLLQFKRTITDSEQLKNLEELIHQEKIGLRNAYRLEKKYAEEFPFDYPTYKATSPEDYDRRYYKVVLQEELSADEIKMLKEVLWEHWYNPYEDGRDCTGVWFTSRIKIVPIAGKTFIYHFQNCDV